MAGDDRYHSVPGITRVKNLDWGFGESFDGSIVSVTDVTAGGCRRDSVFDRVIEENLD